MSKENKEIFDRILVFLLLLLFCNKEIIFRASLTKFYKGKKRCWFLLEMENDDIIFQNVDEWTFYASKMLMDDTFRKDFC